MCLPSSSSTTIRDTMPPAARQDDLMVHGHDNSKGCASQAAAHMDAGVPSSGNSSDSFFGRRLVFFNVAENKTEPELLQLFSQHGGVADMFLVRAALGTSSGCGYVTFATAQQASAALQALQGSTQCAEHGTTLGMLMVQEGRQPGSASTSTSRSNSGAAAAAAAAAAAGSDDAASTASQSPPAAAGPKEATIKNSKAVFFTKVPPTVTSQQLIQLFSCCGEVHHLELFIPWPGAKISRGCGLVEFACSTSAAAAVHSLHQLFTWPHSHSALVVEWVDRNRQSTNSKASKVRPGAANSNGRQAHMGGSPGNMTAPLASGTMLRAEPQAGAGYGQWRPAHGAVMPSTTACIMPHQLLQAQQMGRASNSCPLPQLPPGWQVVATSQQLQAGATSRLGVSSNWASAPSSLSTLSGPRPQPVFVQQPMQMQHGMLAASDGSALALQQQQLLAQQQHDGSTLAWLQCPVTGALSTASIDASSYASLGSVYDATVISSSNFSSTANSAANSGVLQAQMGGGACWDGGKQQAAASASPNVGSLAGQYGESMMAVPGATAGAVMPAASGNDAIYQQLLQQHVLLFQNMTPPSEEEAVVGGQQQLQGLQQSNGMMMTAAAYMPMSQPQQLAPCHVVYQGNSGLAASPNQQQQGQQVWWMQQTAQQTPQLQQQQAVADPNIAVLALPLSHRQLAAMSGVLPEVNRLAGAQAWISPTTSGGLQLCLSGNNMQLNNGHAAVASLLGSAGIDEPLAQPIVHAAAN